LGQLKNIFEISDSDAGVKVEKSGGAVGGEGKCGDAAVERAARQKVCIFYQ